MLASLRRNAPFLLITVFGAVPLAIPAEEPAAPTTQRITIVAQEADGTEVTGHELEIFLAGERLAVGRTDALGVARLEIPADADASALEVASADEGVKILLTRVQRPAASGRVLAVRLFPADPRESTAAQRRERVAFLPQLFQQQRAGLDALPGSENDVTALRLSAFLLGAREVRQLGFDELRELRLAVDGPDATPRWTEVRLVDPLGSPIAGRTVALLGLRGTELGILRTARTNGSGVARLAVPEGELLRAEVLTDELGRSARGPVFSLTAGGPRAEPMTLVLREEYQVLSGFLVQEGSPVEGWEVELQAPNRSLSTRTDRFGYFSLAPVVHRESTLTLRQPRGVERTLTVTPSGDEVMIDLDLLAP